MTTRCVSTAIATADTFFCGITRWEAGDDSCRSCRSDVLSRTAARKMFAEGSVVEAVIGP